MRLHTLSLTAFGPFAGCEHVDFDGLGEAGLFLFTGATGAGKTTILDAVCFALYGQVPGARQAARSLRSDHAEPGVAPEVRLEVTLRGRRLRITRSPAWERPKRRGAGTTTEQARVVVEEREPSGGWTALSTRLDEAGQLLGGLLGLTPAQFFQVVLLPQGQFADFLRADADRRRDLLESLFDTTRFADVEAWLVGRRQETARALAGVDDELRQVTARVAEATGTEPPEDLAPDRTTGWVTGLLEAATAARQADRTAHDRADELARRGASAVAEAQRVADLQARAASLTERLAELDAAAGEQAAVAAELQTARRVAPLLPALHQVEQTRDELVTLQGVVAQRVTPLQEFLALTGTDASGPGGTGVDLSPVAVSAAARATFDELAGLRAAAGEESQAEELEREADRLSRESVGLAARADEVADWLAGADERGAELDRRYAQAREAATRRPEIAARRDRCAARLAAAVRRDELIRVEMAAAEAVRASTDAHQRARDHELAVREARLAGMAAELAGSLHPGQECPVCGSPSHPHPAVAAEATDRSDEDAAVAATAVAEARRRTDEDALAGIRVELAEQRSLAGGDVAVPDLRAEVAALDVELADVQRAADGLAAADQALHLFRSEREGRVRDQVGIDENMRKIREQETAHRARAEALRASVTAARATDPSVAARVARFERAAEDLVALGDLLGERQRLRRALAAAEDRVREALAEHGVTTADEVRAGARSPEHVADLDATLRRHETERAGLSDQLADPTLAEATASPPPDLVALAACAAQADAARTAAATALAASTTRVEALDRLAAAVAGVLARREPLARRHRTVDSLSRLAEGKSADNRLRMSLSAYVLAARLEQVAACASQRLLRMSSGRYTLVHSAQAGAGRGRGGLTLRVLDAWTGAERDPATLSGGESFSASLALALGLADVVTAEAGGAVLETLFVDEGFGSLDDDTLDEVMGVLDDLRGGGRTVGIVSHVADLRQRIPTQLRVEKHRRGSAVASSTVAG